MKPQVETSLGLGYRVPLGPGDGGMDVVAVVAVCEALSMPLAQREPSVFIPPVSLLITINTLVTPRGGQDAAGLKAEGLPGRAPWGRQSSSPPSQVPKLLGQGQAGPACSPPLPHPGPKAHRLAGENTGLQTSNSACVCASQVSEFPAHVLTC